MEIVILASIMGLGLAFTLLRLLGLRRTLRWSLILDALFTLVLPLLFAGSFDGMVLACLSGIALSVILATLKLLTPKSVYA